MAVERYIAGRWLSKQDIQLIQEIREVFSKLSRTELAKTVCEQLQWLSPSGEPKWLSCLKLLEVLEREEVLELPPKRRNYQKRVPVPAITSRTDAPKKAPSLLRELQPIVVEPVLEHRAISLWNEYVHRYHPLGYRQPFGAHQRYFIRSTRCNLYLGCLLFAAAAWALAARDAWIGWTAQERAERLNGIVNNSRMVLFPWAHIRHLASKSLALATKRLRADWLARYGYAPVLAETFVEKDKHRGSCYLAANWLELGETQGRGRMDRQKRRALARKRIFIYPLVPDFREYLCGRRPYQPGGGNGRDLDDA